MGLDDWRSGILAGTVMERTSVNRRAAIVGGWAMALTASPCVVAAANPGDHFRQKELTEVHAQFIAAIRSADWSKVRSLLSTAAIAPSEVAAAHDSFISTCEQARSHGVLIRTERITRIAPASRIGRFIVAPIDVQTVYEHPLHGSTGYWRDHTRIGIAVDEGGWQFAAILCPAETLLRALESRHG
jgi:hypothetical protein